MYFSSIRYGAVNLYGVGVFSSPKLSLFFGVAKAPRPPPPDYPHTHFQSFLRFIIHSLRLAPVVPALLFHNSPINHPHSPS